MSSRPRNDIETKGVNHGSQENGTGTRAEEGGGQEENPCATADPAARPTSATQLGPTTGLVAWGWGPRSSGDRAAAS